MLGGDSTLIPVIKAAKEKDIYVITCDYLPNNIAHTYSDEYINHSTTDKEDILEDAKRLGIDGVLTFTDSGVYSAAYVAEKMGFPSPGPLRSIEILQNKDKFREFLIKEGLNAPKFKEFFGKEAYINEIPSFPLPAIVKPIDSAGSKGVTKVDRPEELIEAYDRAVEFSNRGGVIVEEFIEPDGAQLHGDCYAVDGKLSFFCLGDHHFDSSINNLVPISTTWPSIHPAEHIKAVKEQISKVIERVGFIQGGINIEARINKKNGKAYLIDVGARNGGNFTPIVINYAFGFDFVDSAINYSLNLPQQSYPISNRGFYAYMVIHAKNDGDLVSICISDKLKSHIVERYDYYKSGDKVRSFRGANAAIGILIVKFDSRDEMWEIVENMDSHIKVDTK